MIAAVFAFLGSKLGRLLIVGLSIGAIVLALYLAGYNAGRRRELAVWEGQQHQVDTQLAVLKARSAKISADQAASLQALQGLTQAKTVTLIRKVPVYVTAQDDARCVVNAGAVSLLDAAAGGDPLPAAASGHEQDPSAVSLSDLTATGVFNLGVGNEWRNEALTWRQWYLDQAAAANQGTQ